MLNIPPQVNIALRRLRDAGHEAYIVGGCVRDRLMGRIPGDYDVTTSALPEEVKTVFTGEKVIETGLRHGTVTVLLDGEPLEITTFRVDGDYSDARHPDAVTFTRSLREDLARRDFTVNAMACGIDGGIVDLYGGRADLAAKTIRCVGDPDTRFSEDALRILRALRFAAVLDFSIDANTAAALRRQQHLLKDISAERVRVELTKLLCGPAVRRILLEYSDVIGEVLPELRPCIGYDQLHPCHIYDVLGHLAAVVENIPPESVLRWSALLHDISKPDCRTIDSEGHGHYYGHAEKSADTADTILARLKFDTASRTRIVLLVRSHDRTIPTTVPAVKRTLGKLTPEVFDQWILLKRADNFGQGEVLRHRQKEYDELVRIAAEIRTEQACFSVKDLAVNGNDLLSVGIPKGPEIGLALGRLLDAVIDGQIENEQTVLLKYLKEETHPK